MHRSNSDGGRSGVRSPATNGSHGVSTPPGLGTRRHHNTDSHQSNSLPTADGWGLEGEAHSIPTGRQQAASDAAQHIPTMPANVGGNRNIEWASADQHAQDSSPAQVRSHHGRNRHRNADSSNGRNSGPSSSGRRPSDSTNVQSNIVPIPKRYLNSSRAPARSPSNGQQGAGQYGTPTSRGRHGNTPTGQCAAGVLADTHP